MNMMLALAARLVVGASVVAVGIGQTQAQSLLSVRDTATGEARTFTPEDSSFSLSGNERSLYFTAGITSPGVQAQASWWAVQFEAPEGETLRPGQYLNAGCPFWGRTGRAPGLQVTANNPVCRPSSGDSVWGSYVIRQIGFDAEGRVDSLEATFVQRQGGPTQPPLYGTLRYNARPLQFSARAASGFPWGRIAQDNFGDTSFFSLRGTPQGLVYDASVLKDQWRILIAPPIGTALESGRYRTAAVPDENTAQLFIWRGLNEETCNAVGELNVQGLETDGSGQVTALHATFLYRCPGSHQPLRGTIRHRL